MQQVQAAPLLIIDERTFLHCLRIFCSPNASAPPKIVPVCTRIRFRLASFAAAALCAIVTWPAPVIADDSANAKRPLAASSDAARLANISTRLAVGTNDNVLIAGFIITGTQPKKIIVRGLGPTLPVIENLADPTLELYDSSGGRAAENENWRDAQQDDLKTSGIPPRNDYESAIVLSLEPGAYTAVLAGKGATTGVGLVEVYDLDLAADSKLANISTRGVVGENDDVLIGGTIVLGAGSTEVLFRALGPSLPNVTNALQNPTLELYDSDGSLIATNDDWRDSQDGAIQATTIPPPDSREAAILHQLVPGAYTAIVRGKDNTTGVALVEAYQLN